MALRSVCVLLLIASPAFSHEFRFHRENVLGTSMELRVTADSRARAEIAEKTAIEEIKRLRAILSSYDSNSEISRFVAASVSTEMEISPELLEVLHACDEWNHVSRGAFNVGTQNLSGLWQKAVRTQAAPSQTSLDRAVRLVNKRHWQLGTGNRAKRLSQCALSLNAIAKGYILDHVADRLVRETNVSGIMLNIGGDIRVAGSMQQLVEIANPAADAIGGHQIAEIAISEASIATSGFSERAYKIGGVRYSHIIDPRTGQPVRETVSASVLAPNAATADAMATICSVLSIRESLALVDSLSGIECLLVSSTGATARSAGWPQEKRTDKKKQDKAESKKKTKEKPKAKGKPKAKPTGHEMLVEFEIARPRNSRRYRRPYVAVWVEDHETFPVKTLSLFLMQRNPGPRWYRDIRRWYGDNQLRKLVDETNMIKTVSKPTRNPGKYKVVWDGRDDSGKLLKPGKYTLLIEAAREHGTYQLIKQSFEIGKPVKKKKLKGNVEISSASVTYTVAKSARQPATPKPVKPAKPAKKKSP